MFFMRIKKNIMWTRPLIGSYEQESCTTPVQPLFVCLKTTRLEINSVELSLRIKQQGPVVHNLTKLLGNVILKCLS